MTSVINILHKVNAVDFTLSRVRIRKISMLHKNSSHFSKNKIKKLYIKEYKEVIIGISLLELYT